MITRAPTNINWAPQALLGTGPNPCGFLCKSGCFKGLLGCLLFKKAINMEVISMLVHPLAPLAANHMDSESRSQTAANL